VSTDPELARKCRMARTPSLVVDRKGEKVGSYTGGLYGGDGNKALILSVLLPHVDATKALFEG